MTRSSFVARQLELAFGRDLERTLVTKTSIYYFGQVLFSAIFSAALNSYNTLSYNYLHTTSRFWHGLSLLLVKREI
jgi:hypothetical protein